MAELNYTNSGQTEDSFEAIPAGDYVGMIVESERVASKSNPQNSYLKLQWEILTDGPYKGRKLFENVNLWNSNQQAVEIARKAMDSICTSCGFTNGVKSSEELHRRPVMLKVVVKTNPEYGDQNNIKTHKPVTGGQQPAPQAQPASGAPAWMQKQG